MNELIELFAKERPVGTAANNEVIEFLEARLIKLGYSMQSFPFDCVTWESGKSTLNINNMSFNIEPSPFSEPFTGNGKIVIVKTLEELQNGIYSDSILILSEKLTQNPLSPKNYPFYYPDEHKNLITLLEHKAPKAIIAATGKTLLNGYEPFPFFEDGNFLIPSGNIKKQSLQDIESAIRIDRAARLTIRSNKTPTRSRQIVATKKVKKPMGKIIFAAHMDSKYNTPGALDNAAGVAVLLKTAEALRTTAYDIDIVPFNSEEYFAASGELKYLESLDNESEKIVLMINIDSPCHEGAKTAVSLYNFNEDLHEVLGKVIESNHYIVLGNEWYAGDHAPFVFRGIPCMAVTSSDFFSGALEYTHTPKDTLDTVNLEMIEPTVQCLTDMVYSLSMIERAKK